MDHRAALKQGTLLHFRNDRGEAVRCIIEKELGRGASCIVYEARRETETGSHSFFRLKELYPYKLSITRDTDNSLIPASRDREAFGRLKARFLEDFSRTNALFYSGSNYSALINQFDVFRHNGTLYIVSAYSSDKTLANSRPSSLKECISLASQIAFVLGNIHDQGFIYLDIKPGNVLVEDGFAKRIRLFDFDSLLPMENLKDSGIWDSTDIRLSYSEGFAPVELQTGQLRQLGPYTDVYGLGALLFYLLFGRTPNALDCESDTKYDFSEINYDFRKCDDRLFAELGRFFHLSLAFYYGDRYQNMQEVLTQLEKIEKYADIMMPRLFSTPIHRSSIFYGREQELAKMEDLLSDPNSSCLLVTGMGGIGKSTFIRKYLADHRISYDIVLHVHYNENIVNTINDDEAVKINTLSRTEEYISDEDYFKKKLRTIRELVQEKSAILVIDDFDGVINDKMQQLLSMGLKIILVSRNSISSQHFPEIGLTACSDAHTLRQIFEAFLGRALSRDELPYFEEILHSIGGHTLALGLIAKQIAASHITTTEAAALVKEQGFSNIAPEKVGFEKDLSTSYDTIGNILDSLFTAGRLSAGKKTLIKVFTLVGGSGININQFQKIMRLESKDDLNELVRDGWLTISGSTLMMHSIILETVRRWEWSPAHRKYAQNFLGYFNEEILFESMRNELPKNSPGLSEDLKKAASAPPDKERLLSLVLQSGDILSQCRRDKAVTEWDIYNGLCCTTVLNMPQYYYQYIISECNRLLSTQSCENPQILMRLYNLAIVVSLENGYASEAKSFLDRAERFAAAAKTDEIYAHYYSMLSDYYDILLDGAYCPTNKHEDSLLKAMLSATNKAVKYSRKNSSFDQYHLYEHNLLAKATLLIRRGRVNALQIIRLLKAAKKAVHEYTFPYSNVRLHYYLVCGWYYALETEDLQGLERITQKIKGLSEKIAGSDMERIENYIIPCANMFVEVGCNERAISLLSEGIELCENHPNSDTFSRLNSELLDHIAEINAEE